ncbi:MAG: hypothetical protein KGO98_05325 [Rickettsiales bacterium]|nr:hypothetical protein [Rickettsiales bacterium]
MIPSFFIRLEQLPMLLNGKVDRKALTNLTLVKEDSHVPARNLIEQQICEIWSDVLKIPVNQINITDDFFRLGGDSIISIQLVGKIKRKLGIKVSVKDIFNFKTIKNLYDSINTEAESIHKGYALEIRTEQGRLKGSFGLLPIQKRFFENRFSQPYHWNQSFIISVPELEINKLITSVKELISYHDAFRLRYRKQGNGDYIQYYDDQALEEEIKILDIRSLKNKESSKEFYNELELILTEWQNGFNLAIGPLYSIGYIYGYKNGQARIFFAMHHLIVDTVSWRILLEDLKNIYQGIISSQKGSSYRQWVHAMEQYGDSNENEKWYWESLATNIEHYNKKLENITNSNISTNFFSIFISKEDTSKLLKESGKAYNTEINDLLLAALSLALANITGDKVNYIALEGHGREEIDITLDVSRTIGWFTNIYPVRLEANNNVSNLIRDIKETLRQIPNKGIGYGAILGYSKLPLIAFNYLGQININVTTDKTEWTIVNKIAGIPIAPANKDHNVITINGMVMNGCLEFYISSILSSENTRKLGKLLKSQLLKIIEHCNVTSNVEYTISDFKEFEPYVLFNAEKENNKLFIFPPADGGAESYFNNLATELKTIKLIIFNNYYKFLKENIDNEPSNSVQVIKQNYYDSIDVPKLVSLYLPYLKFMSKDEHYNLCGWSFGGVLALEAAKQLIIQI